MSDTIILTVLAIVSATMASGGVIAQVIAWRRDVRGKELDVRGKQIDVDDKTVDRNLAEAGQLREHTGRFQTILIERLDKLEKSRDDDERRIGELERNTAECERRYTELERKNRELETQARISETSLVSLRRDYENLLEDYDTLREHVDRVEADNRLMRERLGLPARPTFQKPPSRGRKTS